MVSLFFISTFKNILEKKNQPSGKEICCWGKKIKRGCEKLESEVP